MKEDTAQPIAGGGRRYFGTLVEWVAASTGVVAQIVGMIWSAALMLEFFGAIDERYDAASKAMLNAIEQTLEHGPRTPDLGGEASTTEVGQAIAKRIQS